MAIVICPGCGGRIRETSASQYQCEECGARYSVTVGIPDLRCAGTENGETQSSDIAEALVRHYPTCNYAQLLDVYYTLRDLSDLPLEIVESLRQHRVDQLVRGSRLTDMFISRLRDYFGAPDGTNALEIGCGSGAGLVRLGHYSGQVVGLDASLPNLILAKKFCEENGLTTVQLVQAHAECLPFHTGSFAYVTAQNVLEHVTDLERVFFEVARVLTPGGHFAADSRNRYDLVMREPHVKLRWVGMLPRRWASAYVHWRTGICNYDEIAHLRSYWELRRALGHAFGRNLRVVLPRVEAYGMPAKIDSVLAAVEHLPGIRQVLLWIFPSHLALARKP